MAINITIPSSRMTLTSPIFFSKSHFTSTMFSPSSFLTADDIPFDNICDSGASRCAFQSQHFFTTTLTSPPSSCYLGGIANGLPIQGIGTATITLRTHQHKNICLYIPNSLYVPNLPCNLISPQWLTQTLQKQQKKSSFHIFPHGCLFLLDNHIVPLPYHPASNLPIFQLHQPLEPSVTLHSQTHSLPTSTTLLHGFEAVHNPSSDTNSYRTTPTDYDNLTIHQRQLYNWHVRLGHMNFASIQSMARKNLGIPRDLAQCQPPLCRKCQYGKAKQ